MEPKNETDMETLYFAIRGPGERKMPSLLELYGYRDAHEYRWFGEGRKNVVQVLYGTARKTKHVSSSNSDAFGDQMRQSESQPQSHGIQPLAEGEVAGTDVSSADAQSRCDPETFIVLWNPKKRAWSNETRSRRQEEIRETGAFYEEWSLGGRREIQEGDRFYLLKVGAEPRGVIAAGHALGPMFESPHYDKDRADEMIPSADIAWEVLLDVGTLLPTSTLEKEIPGKHWPIQSSGTKLEGEYAEQLESLWADHLLSVAGYPGAAISSAAAEVGSGADIEVEYTYGTAKRRKHQRKFRRLLFNSTDHPECFVCGFDQMEMLEAAHIIPDSLGGAASLENGRILCLNHHRAHDRGLFKFEGDEARWRENSRPFGAPDDLYFL